MSASLRDLSGGTTVAPPESGAPTLEPRSVKFPELIVCPPYGLRLDGNRALVTFMDAPGYFLPQCSDASDTSDGTIGYFLRAPARVRAREQLIDSRVGSVREQQMCAIKSRLFVAKDQAHERGAWIGTLSELNSEPEFNSPTRRGSCKVGRAVGQVPRRAFPRKIAKFSLKSPPPVCSRPIRVVGHFK
jgi:hypothetical protein